MSAAHDDKDHFHIHIAINKIHPQTLRCVTPHQDYPKLMAACAELELAHGLTVVDHGQAEFLSIGGRAADLEAQDGRQSFASWLSVHAAEPLRDAAASASSWADIHAAAAKLDLRFVLRGAGMAITTEDGRVGAKASSVDRSLSLTKLSERLGAFEPRAVTPDLPPIKRYEQAPRERGESASELFAVYTQERNAALAARREDREAQTARARDLSAEIQAQYAAKRERLRRSNRPGGAKQLLYRQLSRERRTSWAAARADIGRARDATMTQNPLPTWTGFLQDRAGQGDTKALGLLRQRRKAQAAIGDAIRAANGREAALDVVLVGRAPKVQRNGDLIYDLRGGGRVVDSKNVVRVDEITQASAFLAVALAAERFSGRSLSINGTVEFENAVVAAAIDGRLNVRFEQRHLEERRAAALRPAPATRATDPLQSFIDRRNETRAEHGAVDHHRAWMESDAGTAVYAGRRTLGDGREVILLQKGDQMLVRPIGADELSKVEALRVGDSLSVGASGSIAHRSRGR